MILGKWNHWSDCAIYSAPAHAPRPCDCGNTAKQPFNKIRNVLHFLYWRAMFAMRRT